MAGPRTYNEELFDAMLRHQIGLQRFAGSVRNDVWALLDAVEGDMKRQILRATRAGVDTPARVRRMNRLLEGLRRTRLDAWSEVRKVWFEEMRELAVVEPDFFRRTIIASAPGVELGLTIPTPSDVAGIVTSTPFEGRTLGNWHVNIRDADISRIEQQVKIGLVQGETMPQISRRIVGSARLRGRNGVTQITRNNAAAISRTVVSGVSAEARRRFSEANKDIAPIEVFTATLDGRTTPICRRLDGTKHASGQGPRLPLHMGERSIYVPTLNGEVIGERPIRNFTKQSLVREYAKENGLGKIAGGLRGNLPRGHKAAFDKFARGRMRKLTGTTPAKTTYQQFLTRQTAAIQDDILGPTRGALFRRGGLKVDKFVELNGNELTLSQLATRHSDAFLKAGLDPSAFV